MNILKFYEEYEIESTTEGENCSPGWVNIDCPFCDDTMQHLGYNLREQYYNCWRCGKHLEQDVIAQLLQIPTQNAWKIIRAFPSNKHHLLPKDEPEAFPAPPAILKLPSGIIALETRHRNYLIKRNFDPDKLIHDWGIAGTNPSSKLIVNKDSTINFSNRIYAPIFYQEKQVSFQTRSITRKANLKYITCPKEIELVHHKHILYGKENEWKDIGICVEGIFDVWRLEKYAFATLGIKFTSKQVMEIVKRFKRVIVIFDDEPQAQIQAKKLVDQLLFLGIDAGQEIISGDPASMSQDDADYLVKEIMG